MSEDDTIQQPKRPNIPSAVAALCTSTLSIMALLMWHGALNRQADNVVTVLALSFIGIVAGTLGVRRTRGRAVAAVCLTISALFFLGLVSVMIFVALALSKMGR